jgi:hypothetical protein
VTGLIASARSHDGALTLLSDWSELALTEQTPAQTTVTPVVRDAVPHLLATRLSLPGFTLAVDGRLVPANAR